MAECGFRERAGGQWETADQLNRSTATQKGGGWQGAAGGEAQCGPCTRRRARAGAWGGTWSQIAGATEVASARKTQGGPITILGLMASLTTSDRSHAVHVCALCGGGREGAARGEQYARTKVGQVWQMVMSSRVRAQSGKSRRAYSSHSGT